MHAVCMKGRFGIHVCKDRGQTRCPFLDACLIADEVLAYFQKRVRNARNHAMAVHGVTLQRTIIWVVVTDDEIGIGP